MSQTVRQKVLTGLFCASALTMLDGAFIAVMNGINDNKKNQKLGELIVFAGYIASASTAAIHLVTRKTPQTIKKADPAL